jgi:hypothetical protein
VGIRNVLDNTIEATVFPNPSSENTQLRVSETVSNYTVRISDISGKVISTLNNQNGTIQLPTADLSKGVYFIHIQAADKQTVVKLGKL